MAVLIIIIINYDNNGNFFVCFASNVHASMMLNKRKKEKREKKSRINIELRFLLICFFPIRATGRRRGFSLFKFGFFFSNLLSLGLLFFAKVCGF